MKTLGKCIRTIVDGIVNVLAFLLVSLGLWLPTLFTVGFFIGCGATGTQLTGGVRAGYWVGLGITALSGVALAVYLRKRKKERAAEKGVVAAQSSQKKKNKRQGDAVQTNGQANGYANMQAAPPQYMPYGTPYPQNGYVPPQQPYAPPGQPYVPPVQQTPPVYSSGVGYGAQTSLSDYAPGRIAAQADTSDLDRKYLGKETANNTVQYARTASFDDRDEPLSYGRTMSKTEERAADDRLGADELWRRLSGTDVPDEQPLVFRTHRDPDLFVYEYSDRYQYWRRTKTGMVFEYAEYKKKATRP